MIKTFQHTLHVLHNDSSSRLIMNMAKYTVKHLQTGTISIFLGIPMFIQYILLKLRYIYKLFILQKNISSLLSIIKSTGFRK